jgi:hypothetical protein
MGVWRYKDKDGSRIRKPDGVQVKKSDLRISLEI